MSKRTRLLITVFMGAAFCRSPFGAVEAKVRTGIEVFLRQKGALKGKRIGLITNQTGVNARRVSTVDLLHKDPGVRLVRLFAPEHGIRGRRRAGKHVRDTVDRKTGLKIFSLYGKTRKPTPAMLKGLDALVFDIQDVGNRAYTYISTLYLAMEAARSAGIRVVVLDRPNPINGLVVDGNVVPEKYTSFLGIFPVAYVHGMTVGELARLFNTKIGARLSVVKMEGWHRSMSFSDTNLPWVPPSPNVPRMTTPLYLPVTGPLGELGLVDNAVGTSRPFEFVGASWIRGAALAKRLNAARIPGIRFSASAFKPHDWIRGHSRKPALEIRVTDPKRYRPFTAFVHVACALRDLSPKRFSMGRVKKAKRGTFDKVCGGPGIRLSIAGGRSAGRIVSSWGEALKAFRERRKRFLLY